MAEVIDIDRLKKDDPVDKKIAFLRTLKNEMIGCQDIKEELFNKGLIETLMPMLTVETSWQLLSEVVTIINCYFFDFPKAFDAFHCYKQSFVEMHLLLSTYKDAPQLVDIVLRIIKNMLISGIVKPSDFEGLDLILAIKPLMTSRNRITVIARIIGLLGESTHF
jgi:hypothetical protein